MAQTLAEDEQLTFGTIVVANTSGAHQIILHPNGGYSNDPGLYVIDPPVPGEYTLTGGTSSSNYTATFTPTVVLQAGANSDFHITDFVTQPVSLQTDGSGELSFTLGATLTIIPGGSYLSNNYSGNLQITLTEDN